MKVIGSDGYEADMIINQGCSLNFTVLHKDNQGNVINHSGSRGKIAFSPKERKKGSIVIKDAITCTASNIYVDLVPEDTWQLSPGNYDWDLIVEMANSEVVRLVFGDAKVNDTYALD